MKKTSSQIGIIGITLALAAVFSWYLYFRQEVGNDTVDIHRFPATIGTWTSIELPLTKDEYEILETHNAFVREYTNSVDNAKVLLYLVYSQDNRKVAHPPEICYTGSGFNITEDAHDTIPVDYNGGMVIKANRLLLNKGSFSQVAYYWFKVSDRFTSNYWHQQALIAFETMLGRHPSSALVRISADVRGDNLKQSITNIKTFANLITPDLFACMK